MLAKATQMVLKEDMQVLYISSYAVLSTMICLLISTHMWVVWLKKTNIRYHVLKVNFSLTGKLFL